MYFHFKADQLYVLIYAVWGFTLFTHELWQKYRLVIHKYRNYTDILNYFYNSKIKAQIFVTALQYDLNPYNLFVCYFVNTFQSDSLPHVVSYKIFLEM